MALTDEDVEARVVATFQIAAWMRNENARMNLANWRRNVRLREAADRLRKEI